MVSSRLININFFKRCILEQIQTRPCNTDLVASSLKSTRLPIPKGGRAKGVNIHIYVHFCGDKLIIALTRILSLIRLLTQVVSPVAHMDLAFPKLVVFDLDYTL